MGGTEETKPARKAFPTSRGKEFGGVEPVFDDVWWAWGTTRFLPGTTFPRNMTIVRESDGLVVIHPVMLPEAEQAKVDALGPVKHVVRLGDFHGMDDALYVARYGAKLWAPRGATPREGAKVDVEMVSGGELPFAGGSLHAFEVSACPEMVVHLRRHGGMLLTCDSVQNWERIPEGCSFLGSLMAKAMKFRGRACLGPGWRSANEPKEGPGFGPAFRRLLELDFQHVIGGHGPPILKDAKEALRASVKKAYPA